MSNDGGAFTRIQIVAESGSTSTDLAAAYAADPEAWPHFSALRAVHQLAGRGRLGREWVTPPGEALTFSVVLLPTRPRAQWPGLGTVAGLAVVRVLRYAGLDAALKWPNDVVLRPEPAEPAEAQAHDGEPDPAGDLAEVEGWGRLRKVAGVLAEVTRAGDGSDAVVLGIGVNVRQTELPVPWATSLALAGIATSPDRLLHAIGGELEALVDAWEAGGLAALRGEILGASATLGQRVSVQVGPATGAAGADGVDVVTGVAEDLDDDGRLLVRTPDGELRTLDSGDVSHLRLVAPEGTRDV